MSEQLLTSMTLSPMIFLAGGLAGAVVFFVIGWMAKASGANRREGDLRREILEAKRSIPQLESTVRNRDTHIARLQEDINELNDRTAELLRESDEKERSLRGAQREVKNLSSELDAIRGTGARDPSNIIIDGFEDERAATPAGSSPFEEKLKKTEALYEKLKQALIKRDAQIEELEARLETAADSAGDDGAGDDAEPALSLVGEYDVTTEVFTEADQQLDRLAAQNSLIADLQNQISELNREKTQLEDLASRRSKSNRALKNASAEAEARIPQLEKQISERDQTIGDREASIKRLLNDLEDSRRTLAARENDLAGAEALVKAKEDELSGMQPKLDELTARIRQRDTRIEELDRSLNQAEQNVAARADELKIARAHISEQEDELLQSQNTLREHEQAAAALKNAIRDREFRIESLESEVRNLKQSLTAAEQTASETLTLSEKRHAIVAAEVTDVQAQVTSLKREIEDLQSQLAQRDQWMTKLKTSLAEREERVGEQQKRADQLLAQLDGLNQQLKGMDDTRQRLETERHELERELVAAQTKAKQAEAALAEQVQSVNVFKSMIADRDFRIESLEHDLNTMNGAAKPSGDTSEKIEASGSTA